MLDPEGLEFRIATRPLGTNVELTVLRNDAVFTTWAELQPPPEDPPRDLIWMEGRGPVAGARVGNLSPAFAEELGLDPMRRGVVVVEVAANSPARKLRLKPGDILVRVNDSDIHSVADLSAIVNVNPDEWRITIKRNNRMLNVVVSL